jgi:predicted ABC-type ATPase
VSRLDLVVGPNGAGKSTFVRLVLAPAVPNAAFVNPDEIAARRWPDHPEDHAYDAVEVAVQTRSALIAQDRDFIAESVFSHESKLGLIDEARDAGYFVAMHVLLVPEELAVARVLYRVHDGGHAVPEEKIRSRYRRLWPLVSDGIVLAHSATVWDNTAHDAAALVATFANGILFGRPNWPTWTPTPLTERWPCAGPIS